MSAIAASAVEAGLPANEAAAAGARGAFLVSAIVALPILVGAFIIRKPADQPEGVIPAH
jgi:DHA2 family lincomycin resistance protein-like MFS transporter